MLGARLVSLSGKLADKVAVPEEGVSGSSPHEGVYEFGLWVWIDPFFLRKKLRNTLFLGSREFFAVQ
jgi:hypothetical protein